MPTWLTGLLVTVRIATSASERPRNSQMSPVAAVATASSSAKAALSTPVTYGPVRVPWKLIGVAGLAGVAATGAIVARRRRAHGEYDPLELRARLHERLAAVAKE